MALVSVDLACIINLRATSVCRDSDSALIEQQRCLRYCHNLFSAFFFRSAALQPFYRQKVHPTQPRPKIFIALKVNVWRALSTLTALFAQHCSWQGRCCLRLCASFIFGASCCAPACSNSSAGCEVICSVRMLLHLSGSLHSPLTVCQNPQMLQKGNARLCAAASAQRQAHRCLATAQRLETLTLKAEDLTPDAFSPFGQVQVA